MSAGKEPTSDETLHETLHEASQMSELSGIRPEAWRVIGPIIFLSCICWFVAICLIALTVAERLGGG